MSGVLAFVVLLLLVVCAWVLAVCVCVVTFAALAAAALVFELPLFDATNNIIMMTSIRSTKTTAITRGLISENRAAI